jgi:hypothetical protein
MTFIVKRLELTSPFTLSTWLNCTCWVSADCASAGVQLNRSRRREERVPEVILDSI